MKRLTALMILVALIVAPAVYAQEGKQGKKHNRQPPPRELQEKRIELKELEIQAEINELHREQQYAQLELDRERMEFNHKRKMKEFQVQKENLKLQNLKKGVSKPKADGKGRKWRGHHGYRKKKCGGMMLFCLLVNILLTVWVYVDIRKRNSGSGLWIVVTLMIGFFGALLYLLARIGDTKAQQQ